MERTLSHRPYIQFVERAALGELGLVAFVGLVCIVFGTSSLRDIGTGFLVTGFGVSTLGVSVVMSSVHKSRLPEVKFTLPSGVRSVDPELVRAMNVSPEVYHLFWVTAAVSAGAFFLGALLYQIG